MSMLLSGLNVQTTFVITNVKPKVAVLAAVDAAEV
jgi:hypothetical protein